MKKINEHVVKLSDGLVKGFSDFKFSKASKFLELCKTNVNSNIIYINKVDNSIDMVGVVEYNNFVKYSNKNDVFFKESILERYFYTPQDIYGEYCIENDEYTPDELLEYSYLEEDRIYIMREYHLNSNGILMLVLEDTKSKSGDLYYVPHYNVTIHECKPIYQIMKIGKVLRRLLQSAKIPMEDKEIEFLVNKFKDTFSISEFVEEDGVIVSTENDKYVLKLVSGNDILHYYYEGNTIKKGTLGKSCMLHVEINSFMKPYTNNPNVCKLLVCYEKDNNKISGRALLWTLDDGSKFLDRIYYTDEDVKLYIIKYANHKKFKLAKPYGGYDSKISVDFNYDIRKEMMPYFDTFMWGNGFDKISNQKIYGSKNYNLQLSDGNIANRIPCDCDEDLNCLKCFGSGYTLKIESPDVIQLPTDDI